MGDRGLIDANCVGQILLAHRVAFAKFGDAPVYWAFQPTSLLSFHLTTVDRCSTVVNRELPTDSLRTVQRSGWMGDVRHKASPPKDEDEEDVTPAFRLDARRALELNAEKNELGGIKKGQPGYLISDQADLAEAVVTSKRMISKIIGPVRPATKVKLVDRSVFVGRIRAALQLQALTEIQVKASRANTIRLIAGLSDEEFAKYEAEALRRKNRR